MAQSVDSEYYTLKGERKRPFSIDNLADPIKRKATGLITELFCTYMEPLCRVSRGKIGDEGSADHREYRQSG